MDRGQISLRFYCDAATLRLRYARYGYDTATLMPFLLRFYYASTAFRVQGVNFLAGSKLSDLGGVQGATSMFLLRSRRFDYASGALSTFHDILCPYLET